MPRSNKHTGFETFSTACPRNCYSTCSFKVRIKDGEVIGIDPHAGNRATSEGPCIKGLAYIERANSPDRILYPLKKKDNGQFERISWTETMDLLAGKLKKFKKEHGPHSVLYYAASGMSGLLNGVSTAFWKLYGGATTTYGNLCWPAGLEATRLTLGENKHNAPWDLENSKLIVFWGKNPAESNIQEMLAVEKAQEQGAQVVVIDPRRTPSTDRAQFLYHVKAGTDAVLALAIARELIANKWIDKDFIDQHVLGFDLFNDSIQDYSLEKAATICRIPAEAIHQLAEMIGQSTAMTIIPGYGMQRYANGGQTIRCILAIQVLTGQLGKPGAGWHYANLQSYVFDEIKEPESYYPGCEDPVFRRSISMATLGEDILKQTDPPIKMIWVERGNPLTQNPNSELIKQAFRQADFRVVVEQFMTDTAIEADLVLPAKNMFEQSDIIGSYWNPYVQLKQKVIDPAGEVKPETELYYLLAKKLDLEEWLKMGLPEPNDNSIDSYLKKIIATYPELDWNALKEGPQLANSHEEIAFADLKFATPSGRIELFSEEAEKKWGVSPLPTYDPLDPHPKDYPLQLMSPNSKNRIHSQFNNLQVIKQFEDQAYLYMHPQDAQKRNISHLAFAIMHNDIAEREVQVKYDMGLRSGCVVMTNGHWHQHGASPNAFTTGRQTDMGYGTAFHDTWIEVKSH